MENSKIRKDQAEEVSVFEKEFSRESMTGPCSNESYIKDNLI
jgi:hypothetical protein